MKRGIRRCNLELNNAFCKTSQVLSLALSLYLKVFFLIYNFEGEIIIIAQVQSIKTQQVLNCSKR